MPVPYLPLNVSAKLAEQLKDDIRQIRLKLNELKEHRLTIDSMLTGAANLETSYDNVTVHYGCASNASAMALRQAITNAMQNLHASLTELITALR